jgi:hypothetical protein
LGGKERGATIAVASNRSDSADICIGNPPSVAYPEGDFSEGQSGLCEKTTSFTRR